MNTLRNLTRRKLRSVLTIAGISIGIVALVVFGAMASKIDGFVSSNVDYLKGSVVVSATGTTMRSSQPLTPGTLGAIRGVPGVASSVPSVRLVVEATGGMPTSLLPDTIVSSDPAAESVSGARRVNLAQGRELQAADATANVAVLGSDIALRNHKTVGDEIQLRGEQFRVVGVYETTTAFPDSEVRVPLAAAQRLFVASLPEHYQKGLLPSEVFTHLTVYAGPGIDADRLAAQIVTAAPGTQTQTSQSVTEEVGAVTRLLNGILIGVALLSLIVGGLSVINTMAMAVAERTREIGIKRAIGGSRTRVVREIVCESAFIGLIGGVVGLAIGAAVVVIGNELGRSTNTILFDLTATTALGAVAFAILLGAVAGLIPAVNAAKMDPVAALRYE